MDPRPNPQRLNALQLKTLAILQALARAEGYASPPDDQGRVALRYLPRPHGNHFHVGAAVVAVKDATGLANRAVFGALARKGLLTEAGSGAPVLTADGLAYDTRAAGHILHGADH